MGWLEFILAIITLLATGGWFVTYRAYRRKANGEATQSEAEGWKSQQEVYQRTIADMRGTCDYISKDRDALRLENTELKEENQQLRDKIKELEGVISDIKKEMSRQGRRIEALVQDNRRKHGAHED